jgi:hypothetical protein
MYNNKMPPKKNTGKKHSVLKDELNITGPGLYAHTPYQKLDKKGRLPYKIGISSNIVKRIDQYHTYFPEGVYITAALTNIKGKFEKTRSKTAASKPKKVQTPKSLRLEIEKFVIDHIVANKSAHRLYSTARVNNANEEREGATEWILCTDVQIHEAFHEASDIYNGTEHLYYVDVSKQIVTNEPKYAAVITGKLT